jgi:D-alanyl-D-alanine carboxypeptidase/D-alanyl-D-alanine-endopeptidase (penicillin-binding protein 4)
MPHPATQLAATLKAAVKKQSVESVVNTREMTDGNEERHLFYSHVSPPLDSIVYWFLKRSVNLYGEALLKTLGYEFTNSGSADSGISVIKNFWKEKGIESSALHIIDGSGLSPGNRITASALVSILEYAKKQSWFSSFYDALPEINGIKMKSGSISGVVSYTGFIRSKTGQDYTFAFMVNNYDGSANEVRRKMWRLLDVLK